MAKSNTEQEFTPNELWLQRPQGSCFESGFWHGHDDSDASGSWPASGLWWERNTPDYRDSLRKKTLQQLTNDFCNGYMLKLEYF